ncbi:unnamed protein product [Lupinus luteus]|uniref:Uncharacterized protein n=1 Tax=Lupinus luteus TaxID=3873 RepID=A0AAV1XZ44_LUPLU
MKPEFKHLTEEDEKEVESKFEIETVFMPEKYFYKDPAKLELRRIAVATIASHCKALEDAFIPYMAMKYFDYFVSWHNLKPDSPDTKTDEEDESMQIKSQKRALELTYYADDVSKMFCETDNLDRVNAEKRAKRGLDLTNVDVISEDSIPMDFDIEYMEIQIENKLPWETYPVTPFYFLDYFYPPFEEVGGFRRRGINEIIVQAQGEAEFMTDEPSHIAFSSLAAAAEILYPAIQIEEVRVGICWMRLPLCVSKLVELCIEKNIKIESASSSSAMPHRAAAKCKGKGKATMTELDQIKEEEEEEEEHLSREMFRSEAPKSLMNFYLQWPTGR